MSHHSKEVYCASHYAHIYHSALYHIYQPVMAPCLIFSHIL